MSIKSQTLENTQLIYIDTCSLMNADSFTEFMESIKDYLHLNNQKIIILGSIQCELNEKLKDEYADHRMNAQKALNYIYDNKHLFDIRKRKEYKSFGDREIHLEIFENLDHKTQVLITQDHGLARDTFNKFNDFEAYKGKPVRVLSINRDGHLYFPEYLDTNLEDESSDINEKFIEEKVDQVTTKYIDAGIKELAILVSGILSGLATPFVLKKLKSCF